MHKRIDRLILLFIWHSPKLAGLFGILFWVLDLTLAKSIVGSIIGFAIIYDIYQKLDKQEDDLLDHIDEDDELKLRIKHIEQHVPDRTL